MFTYRFWAGVDSSLHVCVARCDKFTGEVEGLLLPGRAVVVGAAPTAAVGHRHLPLFEVKLLHLPVHPLVVLHNLYTGV